MFGERIFSILGLDLRLESIRTFLSWLWWFSRKNIVFIWTFSPVFRKNTFWCAEWTQRFYLYFFWFIVCIIVVCWRILFFIVQWFEIVTSLMCLKGNQIFASFGNIFLRFYPRWFFINRCTSRRLYYFLFLMRFDVFSTVTIFTFWNFNNFFLRLVSPKFLHPL